MKTNHAQLTLLIFVLMISMGAAKGQSAYTGSEALLDTAVKQSDSIFTGRIEQIGGAVIKALGEKSYYGVKVKVIDILKGAPNPEVTVALTVRSNMRTSEMAPEVGQVYILLVKDKAIGSQFRVLKLLPTNNSTIIQIKQLITQSSP